MSRPGGMVVASGRAIRLLGIVLGLAWVGIAHVARSAEMLVKFREVGPGRLLPAGVRDRLPLGCRIARALPLAGWHVVEVPDTVPMRRAVDAHRRLAEVVAAEPNVRYRLHRVPDDPQWPRLYGMDRIGAPAAWEVSVGDTNVVVAVFDTGMDVRHPDLAPNLWTNPFEVPANGIDDDRNGHVDDVHGVDFVDGDGDPSDDAGHGTHVAGTVGAAGNDGRGVVGVAWKVKLLPVRVLSADGAATTADFVKAFDYAVRWRRRGVNLRVINCSWGGGFPSLALFEAMVAAGSEGILLVCSAGNDAMDTDARPTFPAGFDVPEILAVGSSTTCDDPSSFSNFGRTTVDLAAPGSGILSTYRGGGRYAVLSGTSMAAPHVSGAAALLFGLRGTTKVAEMRALLMGTADPVPAWEGKSRTGARLNLDRAVRSLRAGNLPAEPAVPATTSGRVRAMSVAASGRWGGGASSQPSISADGRWIAFVSVATNLVEGDREGFADVFLRDRESSTILRVSQLPSGQGGLGDSEGPSVSADGRFVAFVSTATNLVVGDANRAKDVFLWDRDTRRIETASVRSDGRATGNAASDVAMVSPDGSVVAFASDASDLVSGDRNRVRDVFVRDRSRGTTERVSVTAAGGEGTDWSDAPVVSGDGQIVAFHSAAANLVTGDLNAKWDVFVRDRSKRTTERVGGVVLGDEDSLYPVLSADGNWVAFSTAATTFAGGSTHGRLVLMLYDRANRRLIRAGGLAPGAVPEADVYAFGIGRDGRFVTSTTDDPGMGEGGEAGFFRSFVYDRLRDLQEPLGVADSGYLAEDSLYFPTISEDGRRVAFVSNAFGLVAGDGNAVADVFVVDRGESPADLSIRAAGSSPGLWVGTGVSVPARPQRVGLVAAVGAPAHYQIRIANAGNARTFQLRASGVSDGWAVRATSRGSSGTSAIDVTPFLFGAGWTTPTLAAGSNVVVDLDVERNPGASGRSESTHVFRVEARASSTGPVLDGVHGVTTTSASPPARDVVSRGWDGRPAEHTAESVGIDADARRVVFSSEADHLVPGGDANLQSDVFLVDRRVGTVRRLSNAIAGGPGNGESLYPTIDAAGSRVAFQSRADDLVAGDLNGFEDVFVADIAAGGILRVSVSSQGTQGNRGSEGAFIASGGRHVLFTSLASNLVAGDTNAAQDVFLRDLVAGTTECVSRIEGTGFGDADSFGAVCGADARFVVFTSFAANFGSTDRNATADVYLKDRSTGRCELISANLAGEAGDGSSGGGMVTDDGRWVTFHSYASDLVSGTSDTERRSYLLDRVGRTLRRIDDLVGSLGESRIPRAGFVSPDGRWLGVTASGGCGDGYAISQIAVFDLLRNRLSPVSITRAGLFGDGPSFPVRFGTGGRHLAFESAARNLAMEPTLIAGQAFVADLAEAGVDIAARTSDRWRGEGLAGETARPVATLLTGPDSSAGGIRWSLRIRNDGNWTDRFRIEPRAAEGLDWVPEGGTVTAGEAPGVWRTSSVAAGGTLEVTWVGSGSWPGTGDREVRVRVESEMDPSRVDWIAVTIAVDADEDGMPDSWETRYFGGTAIGGAGTDGDWDGAADVDEWRLGTDPTRPGDATRLAIRGPAGNGGARLTWSSRSGVLYRVERAGPWRSGFVEVTAEPLTGTGGEMTWDDAAGATATERYYRLRVEPP